MSFPRLHTPTGRFHAIVSSYSEQLIRLHSLGFLWSSVDHRYTIKSHCHGALTLHFQRTCAAPHRRKTPLDPMRQLKHNTGKNKATTPALHCITYTTTLLQFTSFAFVFVRYHLSKAKDSGLTILNYRSTNQLQHTLKSRISQKLFNNNNNKYAD